MYIPSTCTGLWCTVHQLYINVGITQDTGEWPYAAVMHIGRNYETATKTTPKQYETDMRHNRMSKCVAAVVAISIHQTIHHTVCMPKVGTAMKRHTASSRPP